ncbi:MAG: NUDIX domain-containing protein [Dehalococcoidales bacterium]|nr:NUDIX domain-containing protein [Dehalococcoidales bacterium]
MNTNFLPPKEFKKVFSEVPRLCVDLIIQSRGGVILTLRSLPQWQGEWHLPGSTVRYKETINQAAKRTAHDELGIPIDVLKPLGYIEYPSEERERGFGWAVSLPLLCSTTAERFKVGKDSSEVRVFTSLPDPMIPEQKEFLFAHWAEITRNHRLP